MSVAEREIKAPDVVTAVQSHRRLFTREEYHRAADAGIFKPNEKLELIEGEVFSKVSPQKNPHFVAIRATTVSLEQAFGPRRDVRCQAPLILDDLTEPEPDILVLRRTWRHYIAQPPRQADVMLVVEVSDSTLRADRARKSLIYAKASIPEYWIVNVQDHSVEMYRNPIEDRYDIVKTVNDTESISPLGAPDATINISDLFPDALEEEPEDE